MSPFFKTFVLYLVLKIYGPQKKIKSCIFNHSSNVAHNFIAEFCTYP